MIELVNAIQTQNTAEGLNCIHRALDSGTDPRQFSRQIVEYLRGVLLINLGSWETVDATAEAKSRMEAHAGSFASTELVRITNLFNSAASDLRSAWQPSLSLELALAEAIEPQPAHPDLEVPQRPQINIQRTAVAAPTTTPPQSDVQTTSQQTSREVLQPDKAVHSVKKEKPVEGIQQPPTAQETAAVQSSDIPQEKKEGISTVTLSDIKNHWREIRRLVRDYSIPTQTLLNSCKLLSFKKQHAHPGFYDGYPALKNEHQRKPYIDKPCSQSYPECGNSSQKCGNGYKSR